MAWLSERAKIHEGEPPPSTEEDETARDEGDQP